MINPQQTVAQIVLEHSECANVFQRHRIDFCCKGGMSVEEACAQRGTDSSAVLAELERAIAERNGDEAADPRNLSTPGLIAHIIARHHEYLREAIPFIRGLADKVARVHGSHNPKLEEVQKLFHTLADALEPHLEQEERVLFPALMARQADRLVVEREFDAMHGEHLEAGALIERLRTAAEDFRPPDWACNSYRTLMAELESFEGDLLRHVHLENHVLMPRFLAS